MPLRKSVSGFGIGDNNYDDKFHQGSAGCGRMPPPWLWALKVQRNEIVREVDMASPASAGREAKYHEMNVRYQDQTMEQLRKPGSKEDEPFFLNYWPLYPLTGPAHDHRRVHHPERRYYVEKMKLVDQWIGEIMAEMDELGVADNTIVIVMGDNGHFTKYSPQSGYTPMIFRGGKGSTTEGGVRVDAFRTLARHDRGRLGRRRHRARLRTCSRRLSPASAAQTDGIPTDRIIDGLDQTALWLLNGEARTVAATTCSSTTSTSSRPSSKSSTSSRFRAATSRTPSSPTSTTSSAIPRRSYPVSTEIGAWGGAKFVRMIHAAPEARKAEVPETRARRRACPTKESRNLRPESKAAVQEFLYMMQTPTM